VVSDDLPVDDEHVHYRGELRGGRLDGLEVEVDECAVGDRVIHFAVGPTRIVYILPENVDRAIEIVAELLAYRLSPMATAAGTLRFDFDGYVHAKHQEAR